MNEMKDLVIGLFTAFRFLTIIPLPWLADRDDEYFQKSVIFFPVVGLFIGCLGYLFCSLLYSILPQQILSCIILLYLSGISGFLHLDGLTDTADGLLSYRSRDRKLAIMRDSRIGAMGVIILIFVMLLKYSALNGISSAYLPIVVFLMPITGRCAIVITMTFLPYARENGGLGELFYKQHHYRSALLAIGILLIVSVLIDFHLVPIMVSALIFSVLPLGLWCNKALGGTTGDTLGAVCEITEASVALFLAIAITI